MSKFLTTAAMTAGVMLAAAPAHAVTFFDAPSSDGQVSGDFGNKTPGALMTPFTDTFTFSLSNPGLLYASITSVFSPRHDINFTSVTLNGAGFSFSSSGTGLTEQGAVGGVFTAGGLQTLIVKGMCASGCPVLSNPSLGTTYTGTINFVPLAAPEPASWLMMIGGFGLLGLAARRRRQLNAALV